MKKILVIILMLITTNCFAAILPITIPNEISNEDRARALKLLNIIFENVTDDDLQYDINKTSSDKYTYRGFFIQAKLLRIQEPMRLFLYFKDGVCNACYRAGIAVINDEDAIIDSIDIGSQVGNIDAKLVEYDNQKTCFILSEGRREGNGGISAGCKIYRLNLRKKFEKIYSNGFLLPDGFGWEENIGIGVTLTAVNKSGYRDIIVKEFLNPQPIPTQSVYYSNTKNMPKKIDQRITISMKELEDKDIAESNILKPYWKAINVFDIKGIPWTYRSKIFFNNKIPYCFLHDENRNLKYSLMKYENDKWEYVGPRGFLDKSIGIIRAQGMSNGDIFLAYSDIPEGYIPKIIKFNGTSWEKIGANEISGKNGGLCSECISFFDNILYLCYVDNTNNNAITVKKLVNNNWNSLGTLGYLKDGIGIWALKSSDNIPYVLFHDEIKNTDILVRYKDSKWQQLGKKIPGADYFEINNDIPYVICSIEGDAVVMKYEKNKWKSIGKPIDLGEMHWPGNYKKLVFAKNEIYLVIISQFNHGSGLVIKKYDGKKWQNFGEVKNEYHGYIGEIDVFQDGEQIYLYFVNDVNDDDGKGGEVKAYLLRINK